MSHHPILESLRRDLYDVVLRGRTRPSPDLLLDPYSIQTLTTKTILSSLPKHVRDECSNLDKDQHFLDLTWEKCALNLNDESNPSQTTLNLLITKKRTAEPPLKTIVLLHCTGAFSTHPDMLKNLKRFTVLNYQVVLLNSRHHGCRGDGQFNSQAYLKQLSNVCETNSANTFTNEYPFIYDTAADLISVADYLYTRKDVCKSAMAISGVSLGGMHAWFAAAVDERWRAAAPLIGVQSFEYALRHMCYHARVASLQEVFDAAAERMGEVGVTKEVVVKVWNAICPGLVDRFDAKVSLQLLWPRPIFVGNGELDERCPLAGVVQAVEEARRACLDMAGSEGGLELWVYRGVGHATTEEMWRDCMSFFERVLVVEKVSKTDANDVV